MEDITLSWSDLLAEYLILFALLYSTDEDDLNQIVDETLLPQ